MEQVAALAAIMEAVRSEQRDSFGHVLFRRALAEALTVQTQLLGAAGAIRNSRDLSGSSGSSGSSSLSGELLGVLAGKYMQFADVRWAIIISDTCSNEELPHIYHTVLVYGEVL